MATVGLVACVSRKRSQASEAQCLYDSPLFSKARDYLNLNCDKWYILSARHGLVRPDEIVEPYNETLNTKSRQERKQWAEMTWNALYPLLERGDRVVILAGLRYREFLAQMITEHGFPVDIPMEGKSIGRQLQWLTLQLRQPRREQDLQRLYGLLMRLELGLGGKRVMSECTGQLGWPTRGLYFFFEPGEMQPNNAGSRVVRVGTHCVSRGSKTTLWDRLRTHRGTGEQLGNHRSSIFRLHVGAALAARNSELAVPSWGAGQSADAATRAMEEHLERAVSEHIGRMNLLWLAVEDEASPWSDRAYLERNLIGLLVGPDGPADPPSHDWLGLFSPNDRIRKSGMWNLDFLDYVHCSDALDVLEEYVSITIGNRPQPSRPIAPSGWYAKQRQRTPRDQLSLFGENEA